ncbi:putative ribonuclease H-like domain-containing protein, partial [Tanacetum coccineum]
EFSEMEADPAQDYFVLPIYSSYTSTDKSPEVKNEGVKHTKDIGLKTNEELEFAQSTKDLLLQAGAARATSTNTVNTVSTPLSTANPSNVFSIGGLSNPNLTNYADQDDSQIPALEEIYGNSNDGIFTNASYDDEGAVADFTNLETIVNVSPIPTSRIHSIHPTTQILRYPKLAVQTRSKVNKSSGAHAFKISEALEDESLVDAMQEELLQFKIQKGYRQDEGIDYDEVFAHVARIEAIRIFLAFASYMGFIVYQMDVKSAFLYGTINEEVYVSQPLGFVDPKFPKKVYKVVKTLYGIHQASRAWYATLSTFLLKNGYRRGTIDKTLFIKKNKNAIMLVQVKQKEDGIFISQDKYVVEILKKFDFMSVKTACTPIETHKPLVKDEEEANVDVHLYRSMIGSLMYLTASRLDIMFVVCACSKFQVTPKTSHLHDVKRNFRYLKGKPKFGLWYPRESYFDLVAYSDSDYGGANLDRKSTTGEAEYVAATNCCGQVLWIHNQMLDYGFNFMNTRIYIDNESTICIVKNLVFHSKTKHIEIRHHFIRNAYEKKLIQVLKIHTDDNVADLLTKVFDFGVEFLVRRWVVDDMMTFEVVGHQNGESEQTDSALAIPGQTTTGKESSNPLMADSLPKTIQSNDPSLSRGYTLGCGENSLELMELMAYWAFSLQWKFFIHTILYCFSPKKTAWDQFSSNLATAIICLATKRIFNFSKFLFEAMVSEASIRRHLKLEDSEGLSSLPNAEIFEQMANMG